MKGTSFIIGCGESSKEWNGQGFSIGVNDCWAKVKKTDIIVTVNSFNKEPDRKDIIMHSLPEHGLYSNLTMWNVHPCYKPLIIQKFKKGIEDGIIYHATTSPIIAVSLAQYLGFTKFVLYGVDFTNHRNVKGSKLKEEVNTYLRFQEHLKRRGCEMFLGVNYGAFKDKLRVYDFKEEQKALLVEIMKEDEKNGMYGA